MSVNAGLRPNLRAPRGGRRKAPTVLQMETTECAAASLAMVLAHHGRWVPLEVLRVQCGVSRDGANAANMMRAARDHGLVAQGFRSDREGLFDLPFPMVLFWEFKHFVVLEGMRGKRIFINDPGEGPRRLTPEEFDRSYSGTCFAFAPGSEFRPGGKPPDLLRGLIERFGQARAPLAYAMLTTLALTVPGIAIPALVKTFIDGVIVGGNGAWVAPLMAGLGVAAAVRGALTWLQRTLLARLETKLSIITTARFFWHVAALPMTFFGQRYAGDITSRVVSNDAVARLLSGELAINAVGLITMVVYAVVLLAYDPVLTLIVMVMAGINLAVLRLSAEARENANNRLLRENGRLAGASVNGIQIIETLKANGAEGDFFARWSGMHANVLAAQQRLGLVTTLANAAPPLLVLLATVAILGFGGLRIFDGTLTVGGLVAFQLVAAGFLQPVGGLVQFGASLQRIKGHIARLDDVLNYAADERTRRGIAAAGSGDSAPAPRGFVDLENITFGYNVKDAPLIEDFSLSIAPGRRIALVGGSGSGKSTVAKLVCGLLAPWSGCVRIDGEDLAATPPSRFAETVALVDQDIMLFEGSVRDNVTLWDPTIGEDAVVRALRDASIHDLVASRPLKYDSPVEENGRNFSGGQRQRLEIARALARDPAVLVLDEATAALDPVTELEIDDRLRRRGCTCLIIAHRLSTVRDADEIIVLERGRIVQRGVHEDLVNVDGTYRQLVSAD